MEEKKTQTADKGAALRDVPKVHENAEAPGEAEVTELKKAAAKGEGKQKSSANMLAAKLKTRKLRMAVGTVVLVVMAAGLIAGVSMMSYGAVRGEAAVVLGKAIKLCLECVGIG